MPLGPGKYGALTEQLRERLKAEGVVLIVLAGMEGNGFSAALSRNAVQQLPDILEDMARQIRKDHLTCANS